jgi:hypothetical protein
MVAIPANQAAMFPLSGELPLARGGKMRGGDVWAQMVKRDNEMVEKRIALLANLLRHLRKDDTHFDADAIRLAAAVRARFVKGRVPGSRWAQASGCGTVVEGEEDQLRMACGMGHVPEKARRFLYFYAKTPGEQLKEWMENQKKKDGRPI